MRRFPMVLTAVVLATLSGCLFPFDPKEPAPYGASYSFGFVNVTNEHLAGVELYMMHNGQEVNVGTAGCLIPSNLGDGGKTSKMSAQPQRIPDEVILRWRLSKGATHQQTISLAGIVPDMDHFKGTVWFRYERDSMWHPVAWSEEQMIQSLSKGKGYAPDYQ